MFIFIVLFISCYYFFKILKIFSCSGMFRNVPECSMFRVLSTASYETLAPLKTPAWEVTKFLGVLRLSVNPIETLCIAGAKE